MYLLREMAASLYPNKMALEALRRVDGIGETVALDGEPDEWA